jgi:hypothetical protein
MDLFSDKRFLIAIHSYERQLARPRPLEWCKTLGPIPLIRV